MGNEKVKILSITIIISIMVFGILADWYPGKLIQQLLGRSSGPTIDIAIDRDQVAGGIIPITVTVTQDGSPVSSEEVELSWKWIIGWYKPRGDVDTRPVPLESVRIGSAFTDPNGEVVINWDTTIPDSSGRHIESGDRVAVQSVQPVSSQPIFIHFT